MTGRVVAPAPPAGPGMTPHDQAIDRPARMMSMPRPSGGDNSSGGGLTVTATRPKTPNRMFAGIERIRPTGIPTISSAPPSAKTA